MEAADPPYGVSMGSDGISKVISRRLPEAEEPDGSDATPQARPDAERAAGPRAA